jgi:hypothetical protein
MQGLTATDQSITLVTGSAVTTDYVVTWSDNTTTVITPGSGQGNITTATTTEIIAAPAASTYRAIKGVMITNRHASSSQTVQLFKLVDSSSFAISQELSLLAGQTAVLSETGLSILTASQVFVASGKLLQAHNSLNLIGTDGTTQTFPTTNAVIARTDAANTFTGTQTYSGRVLVDDVTDATTTTNGSLQTDGGLSVAKKANIGGAVTISDTTASTSITTGALIVSGGVGISGAINMTYTNTALSGTLALHLPTLNVNPASTTSAINIATYSYVNTPVGCSQNINGAMSSARFDAYHNGTGTASSLDGLQVNCLARGTAGGVSSLNGVRISWGNSTSGGSITNAYGVQISNLSVTGSITNAYGIFIGNVAGASGNNYALYTSTGLTKHADTTASTTTTSGALVVTGGIGCGDYFTGKHRSSDGTAGTSLTRTFYTASSSGGTVNVLNTVTIKDGIITAWTQA